MVLSNCFVTTPVCSPSRASLLTSRYGSELGITDWINPRVEQTIGLDTSVDTWSRRLQAGGYATCLVGKWHLGTDPRYHPHKHGFDHFKGFLAGGVPVSNPALMIEDVTREFTGYTDEILTDMAIDYLHQDHSSQPFLLCLHYRSPHAPWKPVREEDTLPYQGMEPLIPNPTFPGLDVEKVKEKTCEYLSNVTGLDRNVGRVLRELEQSGLGENTVVIFTSDNGYNLGHNGIWHKGNGHKITLTARNLPDNHPDRQRPNMYDHSLRVPTAIRWTGKFPAGTTITHTITSLDWYPTLLALANVPQPTTSLIRGHSFLPLLEGNQVPWEKDFYAEYSQHHYTTAELRMYRTPEWKLVLDTRNQGRDELYHLTVDPGEATNLVNDPAYRTIQEEMKQKIERKRVEVGNHDR
jgi:uncharacterized sulfatase